MQRKVVNALRGLEIALFLCRRHQCFCALSIARDKMSLIFKADRVTEVANGALTFCSACWT